MEPTTPGYRMADRLAGGRLAEIIREHLAAGNSFDQVTRLLYRDHGIEVTRPTLVSWVKKFDTAEPAEKSA